MTVSVILPVYNTGVKLKSTVNSILKQDFQDFELLLIDDGSTDTLTKGICAEYHRRDNRVRVFTKENEGIEKTKIFGINNAEGDYIIFSDHDDLYLPGAFTKLVRTALRTDADIVAGNYYEQYFRKIPYRVKGFVIDKPMTLGHKEFMDRFYINFFGYNLFNVSTWAKIYKTSLLKDIDFISLGYNTTEDVVLNIQIFPKAQQVVFIKEFLYVHIRGGITSNPNPELLLKNYEVLFELKKDYIEYYSFSKGLPYINIEMKNILQHYVRQSVKQNDSLTTIRNHMELFKNSETYSELAAFYYNKLDDLFMKNFLSGDYEAIYSKAILENNKITLRKIVKKVLYYK